MVQGVFLELTLVICSVGTLRTLIQLNVEMAEGVFVQLGLEGRKEGRKKGGGRKDLRKKGRI